MNGNASVSQFNFF